MRLKDKIAVVTGGGGGIGEGICLCLAREGAHVVVSDVDMELAERVAAKVSESGQKSLAVQTDVRKADQCQALVDTAIKEFGGLDILVCSAGIMGFSNRDDSDAPLTIENMLESDWDMTIDVNLKGVFLCNRAVIPYFKKRQAGKIINIASVAGRQGVEFLAPYAASKAGVINLSQAVALHMAPFSVNVNVICPGIVWTPMWAQGVQVLTQRSDNFKGVDPEMIFNGIVQTQIPLKRVQMPEDIGNAVVFLVSEEAKEITGQALNVCGGMKLN
ncbi:MAG: SDR family oxidoreductase [Deltaproteobacteria bacterium]|nr:SDR family oxidoreductase [Deltaproteobacteria bacterium]MBW2052899.1 SDR family oxidoreductase [Deltaproteobacteria bacterium]MBW2141686.1 SDR family oxidoreductase [Deltaproteobacteria bacterium]